MFGSSLPPVVCRTISGCLQNNLRLFVAQGSCLIYVICVCLRIVMSNTYCVVFLFCFSSSCVPYVVNVSGLSIIDCPSVFSNVYSTTGQFCNIFMINKPNWRILYQNPENIEEILTKFTTCINFHKKEYLQQIRLSNFD